MLTTSTKTVLGITCAVFIAAIAAYIVFVKIASDLANTIANGVKETFNVTPRVTINETVVIEQTTPILELATLSRDVSVDYSWSHQWLGSTKTIALRGTFTAKAGFDLKEPFAVHIQRFPVKVRITMPRAKLLSLQMNSYDVVLDENGWWNRIADADREAAVRMLQQSAAEKARTSGMLAEAEATVEQRIRDIIERSGGAAEVALPWRENGAASQ